MSWMRLFHQSESLLHPTCLLLSTSSVGPQPNTKWSPNPTSLSVFSSAVTNFMTSQTFKCPPQNKQHNSELTLQGTIIIPHSQFSFTTSCLLYLFPVLFHIQCYWSSAICCFSVVVPLSSFWNGKAITLPLSVSLQLFDGIECEFPIFFIYMMIDGKPCSIHSCYYDASSGSLAKWKTDL